MKLGEIKIEALKLMFADYTNDIAIEDLQELKTDENYGRYLNSMPGSINRCFSRLESSTAVPLKTVELKKSDGSVANGRIRFNLSSLFEDFDRVDRIVYETKYDYNGNCDYIMETNSIIVLEEREENYTLIYSPALERITNSTNGNFVFKFNFTQSRCSNINCPFSDQSKIISRNKSTPVCNCRNIYLRKAKT